MTFLRIVAGIIYLTVSIIAAWKLTRPEEEEPEIEYSYALHQKIERIAEIDREIQLIYDMLTNLSTADHPTEGDCLRSMEVYWDWGGKLGQQAPFPVAKGTATADAMRNLAEVRREELIHKLTLEIRSLPYLEELRNTQNGIIKTSTERHII